MFVARLNFHCLITLTEPYLTMVLFTMHGLQLLESFQHYLSQNFNMSYDVFEKSSQH